MKVGKLIKKIIISFFISAIIIFTASGEEIKTKNLMLVKQIPVGQGNGELAYEPYSQLGGPVGIGINDKYDFYISDCYNKRLNIYNNDLLFQDSINLFILSIINLFETSKNNLIIGYSYGVYHNYDITNKKLINVSLGRLKNDFYPLNILDHYLMYNNLFIAYSRQDMNNSTRSGIVSIQNPSADNEQNIKNFRNTNETHKLIKSEYKELILDEKDRIILNGKILTRIFSDYLDYWAEKHKNMTPPKGTISIEEINNYNYCLYLGKDNDDNKYWGNFFGKGYIVFVFDKEGWLLAAFIPKNIKIKIHPAIHPLGDVYYLDFDGKSNYLYMVPRTWGYDKTAKGTCTEKGISIRLRPSIKADILGKLNKNDEIEIIDKTDIKLQVEDAYNYWYKIKLSNGTMAWVFGDYVKE